MSARADADRREAAHAAAIERGKEQLRVLQAVLTHFTEGLSCAASAERLGLHRVTVQSHRATLHLARWVARVDTATTKRGG